jgi:hypothetical protein
MKKYLAVILFLLLISFTSAIKFGIGPDKIVLSGENNELICANFTILGDNNLIFNGTIKFSERETKELTDYQLSAEDLSLKVIYDRQTFVGQKQICVIGKNVKYSGALTYNIVGTNYGIGTWLEINIGNENVLIKAKSITGNAIKNFDNSEQIGLGVIFISLLILFMFSIKNYNQRKKLISSC